MKQEVPLKTSLDRVGVDRPLGISEVFPAYPVGDHEPARNGDEEGDEILVMLILTYCIEERQLLRAILARTTSYSGALLTSIEKK